MEVTESYVNHGAGYGLAVPCIHRLYGPRAYIERIHEIVQPWTTLALAILYMHVGATVRYRSTFCMYLYYCVRISASVIRNSEVACYSGAFIVLYIMETSIGAYTSVRYSVDVCYWECPLIETPLYTF